MFHRRRCFVDVPWHVCHRSLRGPSRDLWMRTWALVPLTLALTVARTSVSQKVSLESPGKREEEADSREKMGPSSVRVFGSGAAGWRVPAVVVAAAASGFRRRRFCSASAKSPWTRTVCQQVASEKRAKSNDGFYSRRWQTTAESLER
uniref:Secreted protein n=1 Tax=Anopheles coluzzii TaxID=1518534 RepID=A0A6E8W7H7_ANOCL